MTSPFELLSDLSLKIKQGYQLRGAHFKHPSFRQWRREAISLLSEIGDDVAAKELREVQDQPSFGRGFLDDETRQINRDQFEEAREEMVAILNAKKRPLERLAQAQKNKPEKRRWGKKLRRGWSRLAASTGHPVTANVVGGLLLLAIIGLSGYLLRVVPHLIHR